MCFEDLTERLRREVPIPHVVSLCQRAARETEAHLAGRRSGREPFLSHDETRSDSRGDLRRAKYNDLLMNMPRLNGLQVDLPPHKGGGCYAEIKTASFVITPKFLMSSGQKIPPADYRQLLELEMPIFQGVIKEDPTKAYLVLAYTVDPRDPCEVTWMAFVDPTRQYTLELTAELEAVHNGTGATTVPAAKKEPAKVPPPKSKLKVKQINREKQTEA